MVLLLFVGTSSSWYCCGVGDSSTGGGCSHWFKVRSELVVVLHVLLWCIMVREYLYSPAHYAIAHVCSRHFLAPDCLSPVMVMLFTVLCGIVLYITTITMSLAHWL